MSRIRLTIGSELKDAALIGQSVHAICRHLQMPEDIVYGVELCVVEAVTNAIKHAYGMRAGFEVEVALTVEGGRLNVEVSDFGQPMPPDRAQVLRHGSGVLDFDVNDRASLPEGGMGLQIIHLTMDEAEYITDGHANHLRMVKLLPPVKKTGSATQAEGTETGEIS